MSVSPDKFRQQPEDHEFGRELVATQRSQDHLTMDDLQEVRLNVTADLGECRMRVRDVLNLRRGSIIALNKLAGEMADIQINGIPVAKGEVVVLGDALHVRVAEVLGAAEKEPVLHE